MAYNLIITDRADELIDERVGYLLLKFNKMVFRVDGNDVYVVGLFHELEDYAPKVTE